MKSWIKWLLVAGSAVLAGASPGLAQTADAYPQRPIRVIVPSGPGGGYDVTARLVTRALSAQLKQPFVVENKVGAAGTIGAAQVAKSTPDGYTLMWTGNSPLTLAPFLNNDAGYDPLEAFMPISTGVISSYAIMVASGSPINSIKDLVARGKEKSKPLTYASNGQNSSLHLLGLLLSTETGMDTLHVPYKGGAEGVTAVMSGQVDFTFDASSTAAPFVKSGKLKALAVTGKAREPSMPQVPTFQELDMPSMTFEAFYGLLAPAGTPQSIIDQLATAMKTVVADPEVMESITLSGNNPRSSTPDEFKARIAREAAAWKAIMKAQNIHPNS